MQVQENEILVHARAIAELLKEIGDPHAKIEISIGRIEQTSVDWSMPTEEWLKFKGNEVKGFVVATEENLLIANIDLADGKIIETEGYKVIEYTDDDQLLFREQQTEASD